MLSCTSTAPIGYLRISNRAKGCQWLVGLREGWGLLPDIFFLRGDGKVASISFKQPCKKFLLLFQYSSNYLYTSMASKFLFSKLTKPLLGSNRSMMVSQCCKILAAREKLTCFAICSIAVVLPQQPTCFLRCAKPSCLMALRLRPKRIQLLRQLQWECGSTQAPVPKTKRTMVLLISWSTWHSR